MSVSKSTERKVKKVQKVQKVQFAVTSYYYVGQERGDSGIDFLGIFDTHKEAYQCALQNAEKILISMDEMYNEDNEDNCKTKFVIDDGTKISGSYNNGINKIAVGEEAGRNRRAQNEEGEAIE